MKKMRNDNITEFLVDAQPLEEMTRGGMRFKD